MTTHHARLAQLALEKYGLGDAQRTLSQDLFNTTYCVTDADGQKYNLRLCGAAVQDRARVRDELVFLDFVAQRKQIRVPKPVRNLDGEFVTRVESVQGQTAQPRICCLFEWIEGEVVREHLTGSVMHKMGSATAHLHQAARDFRYPTPDEPFRQGYDYDEAVIIQHREWMAEREAEIGPVRMDLLNRAVDHLLAQFGQLPKNRQTYGFIHADLNPNNYLVTNAGLDNEEVSVIDFEQLGRGHYPFDLATTMVDLEETKIDFDCRWSNFKAGYRTVAELPFADDSELAPFVMTVHLNFLDWLYNTPSPHVRAQYESRFQEVHELIQHNLER